MSSLAIQTFSLPPQRQAHADPAHDEAAWWTRRGPWVSLILHAAAVAALSAGSAHVAQTPPERTLTLVQDHPAPAPLQLTQPKLETHPAQVQTHPLRVAVAAQPRTVAAPAAAAELAAQPATSNSQADTSPAATLPSAPVASAGPRIIQQEGIPSDYVNQVFARINRSAGDHYPRIARMKHLEGRVAYRLTLAPDGSVLHCELRSSGDDTLDTAATAAILAAAPFPHLPDLGGSAYVLSGAIVYQAE